MQASYDYVIIGSGMGGLACGVILAKEGYSVCILEKNKQYGGNLQTFARSKSIFDTGVHYLGGLEEGQNLYGYFKYFGIIDGLQLQRLDMGGFDVISFDGDDKEYRHAQGFDGFVASLSEQFPEEEPAIQAYVDKLVEVCTAFPLYNLQSGTNYTDVDGDLFTLGAREFIDSLTDNPRLRAVLGGSNLLYAGDYDKSPFYVHALSVNSYLQSSYRVVKGGSQITRLMVKKLRELGGDIFKEHEVSAFEYEDKTITAITCTNGVRVQGKTFISNADPKLTLQMAGESRFRSSYIKRVKSIEPTIGCFSLYVVLKPDTFKYLNYNHYHFRSEENVWEGKNYSTEEWPGGYMISMGLMDPDQEYTDCLTIMTYMRYDEVAEWEGTFNTVADKHDRGESYDEFKTRRGELLIDEVEKKFPDFRKCILETHASTPLSYRDYIACDEGGMYGYVKDARNPLRSFLSPRTKVPNLFMTGQCTNMHGILGVSISAVNTCTEILGKDYFLDKVLSEIHGTQVHEE